MFEHLKDHIIVCGCGTTGMEVIRQLEQANVEILVIDSKEESVAVLMEEMPNVLVRVGDATDPHLLDSLSIDKARGLTAVLPVDRDNLFIAATARQKNSNIRIVSRCKDIRRNQRKMKAVGVDTIVSPNLIGGLRMVSELVRPRATEFLDELLHHHQYSYSFQEVRVPQKSKITDRPLAELHTLVDNQVVVVALRRFNETVYQYSPDQEVLISGGDTLVLFGTSEERKNARLAITRSN